MVVYKIAINERRKPDEIIDINNVCGKHIGDLFIDFCKSGSGKLQEASQNGKYIQIGSVHPIQNGIVVSLLSGLAGDERQVFDVESAKKKYDLHAGDASMVSVRSYLTWKNTGKGYALLCVEHSANAAGDTVLFNPFKSYLRNVVPDVVVKFEPMSEIEVLEQFDSLERVEVRRYLGQGDRADQLTREGDCISYVINHKRGRPFGIGAVKDLLKESTNPAVMLGYSGTSVDSVESEIIVSLKDKSGRTTNFSLGGDYAVKVRQELNARGEKPLSDDQFIEACDNRCEIISERLGRAI